MKITFPVAAVNRVLGFALYAGMMAAVWSTGCGGKPYSNEPVAPIITSTPDTNVVEGSSFQYAVVCADANDDDLTLTVGAQDTCGGTLTDNGDGTGTYGFDTSATSGGTQCVLHVQCSDGELEAEQLDTVRILETNGSLSITNLPTTESRHWREGGNFATTAEDTDDPADTFAWSLSGNTCTFAPTIDGASGVVTWACDAVQTCQVDVTVADDGTPLASDTETLTLACTNTPPTADATPAGDATEGEPFVVAVTCSDADGDPLTLAVGGNDTCGGALVDNGDGTGVYTVIPSEAQGGDDCLYHVTCSDSQQTDGVETAVTVVEHNTPPVISNLPATATGHWDQAGTFTAAATDDDLPAENLAWSITASTCSFSSAVNSATGEVTWLCAGTESCAVDVTVTDDGSPTESDTGTLTIACGNSPPNITSTPQPTANESVLYTYAVICDDADGDPLALSLSAADTCDGTVLDHGNGTATYSFTAEETWDATTCSVAVLCTDSQSTTEQARQVTILEDNLPPTIENLPATESGRWGESDAFAVNVADGDYPADPIVFNLSNSTCSFAVNVDPTSGLVTWTCGNFESCAVDVTATDDGDPVYSDTSTLSIQCLNSLPEFTSTGPVTATEGVPYTYDAICTDPEGDALTLTLGGSHTCGGALTDHHDGTATYTFTPTETQGGVDCLVHLRCADAQSTESQLTTVDVDEVNRAPQLANLGITEAGHWGDPDSYDVNATDDDLPANELTFSLDGDDCSFAVSVAADTGVVSWTCGDVETCAATVRVTDNGSPTESDTGTLTIQCDNTPPAVADDAPTGATEEQPYTYDITCTDADGDTVTLLKGAGDTCGGSVTDDGGGSGTYAFTPTEAQGPGDCVVSVACNDTQDTTTRTATVTVDEVNIAPGITNLDATELGSWGQADSYDVDAADTDLPANDLTFSLDGDTCTFAVAVAPDTGVVSWTCGDVETCTATVRVADGGTPGLADTGTLTIVCANTAPAVTSTTPTPTNEGQLYTYNITCVDPDGDNVTLTEGAGNTCGGSVADNGGGSGTYTFTPSEALGPGDCNVSVACTDSQATTTDVDTVTVNEVNVAPQITNLGVTETGHWGQADSYDVDASDTDVPANGLAFSLAGDTCSFTPMVASDTGVVSWTCGSPETCTATIRVTDDGSPAASSTGILTIVCDNQAPNVTSTPPDPATEGQPYTYDITCVDPDGDAVTLTEGVGNSCGGTVAGSGGTGTYTFTPTEAQGPAGCVVSVACLDTHNASTQAIAVGVNEVNVAPQITNLGVTETGRWGQANSFDVDASDTDLPANDLTFSLDSDTCSFAVAVDPDTGVVSWTCGDVENCAATVRVEDSGTPKLADTGTLDIACTNTAPSVTSTPSSPTNEGQLYTYDITCTDDDGDDLELDVGAGNSCGGTVQDNGDGTGTYTFTPTEAQGPGDCDVSVTCADSQVTITDVDTITVNEVNVAPSLDNLPATAHRASGAAATFTPTASDTDQPVNGLGWGLSGNTCSFTPTIDGATGEVSWTCTAYESCAVDVTVTDNGSPNLADTETLSIVCGCRRLVDVDTPSSAPDGLTWAEAFPDVQSGIDEAWAATQAAGGLPICEVWVAAGIYYTYDTASTDTVLLRENVDLYGGFDTSEADRADRDWETNVTILHGEDVTKTTFVSHVVTASVSQRIDGFTITKGNANTGAPYVGGGGLVVTGTAQPTIANCTFLENNSISSGGGLLVRDSAHATVENGHFVGNGCAAAHDPMVGGGGIAVVDEATLSATDLVLERNGASTVGGGLYVRTTSSTPVTLSRLRAIHNVAAEGGALYVYEGEIVLENAFLAVNQTTASNAGGGAIYGHDTSVLTIRNATLAHNASGFRGGGIYYRYATNLTVENTVLFYNGAPEGPQLYCENGCTVAHSNIQGGFAGTGNLDLNPRFRGVPFRSGTWETVAYDPDTRRTTLTDTAATFTPGAHVGQMVHPDINEPPHRSIRSNTATTVVVVGDIRSYVHVGDTYNVHNHRLDIGSPCIDSADGDQAPDEDIDGQSRYDDPATANTGVGTPPHTDMGAWEYEGTSARFRYPPDHLGPDLSAEGYYQCFGWINDGSTAAPTYAQMLDACGDGIEVAFGGYRCGDSTLVRHDLVLRSNLRSTLPGTIPAGTTYYDDVEIDGAYQLALDDQGWFLVAEAANNWTDPGRYWQANLTGLTTNWAGHVLSPDGTHGFDQGPCVGDRYFIYLKAPMEGSSAARAGRTCRTIYDAGFAQGDGVYWIDPDGSGGNGPFQAICDMTSDGGGWTQVANFVYPGPGTGAPGWTAGAGVGSDFTNESATFKMSDALYNAIRSYGYRVDGQATICNTGSCPAMPITRYWTADCIYSSGAQSPACNTAYRDVGFGSPAATSPTGPCAQHYGLNSVDCSGPYVEVIESHLGDHVSVGGNDNWSHAYSGRGTENPELQTWVR